MTRRAFPQDRHLFSFPHHCALPDTVSTSPCSTEDWRSEIHALKPKMLISQEKDAAFFRPNTGPPASPSHPQPSSGRAQNYVHIPHDTDERTCRSRTHTSTSQLPRRGIISALNQNKSPKQPLPFPSWPKTTGYFSCKTPNLLIRNVDSWFALKQKLLLDWLAQLRAGIEEFKQRGPQFYENSWEQLQKD